MAVIPLCKPREKPWAKKTPKRGKASQIKDVFAKFEEVDNRKSDLSSQNRTGDKKETDNRLNVSCLKGFTRGSPGMW